jgi:hypothetical protein
MIMGEARLSVSGPWMFMLIHRNYLAPLFVNSQTDKANKLW